MVGQFDEVLNGVDFAVKIDVVEDEMSQKGKIGGFQKLLEVVVRDFVVGKVEVLQFAGREGKSEGNADVVARQIQRFYRR